MSNNFMMEIEFKGKIFIPKTGFDWRLNSSRLYFGGFILLTVFLMLTVLFDLNSEIIKGISFFLILLIIVGSRWGYNERQKKFGKLNGELRITDDYVSVNGKEYAWSQVSNFSFNLLQVLDEQLWREDYPVGRYYGGPAFSAGVDNYIDFNTGRDHHRIYFQLDSPSHKIELSNILKRQYFMGNIELQRTYDGLHLEYEQIQELKKAKSEWRKGKAHNIAYE